MSENLTFTPSTASIRCLKITVPVSWGIQHNWIREIATGELRGTTGLSLDVCAEARLSAAIEGEFTAAVYREDDAGEQRIRLVLKRSRAIHVSASAETVAPASIDNLALALLGIHPLCWLRELLNETGSLRWSQLLEDLDVTAAELERLLDAWRALSVSTEAALWRAIACRDEYERFCVWMEWIARHCPDARELAERVRAELTAGDFTGSPAACWIEAVAGCPLAALATLNDIATLRSAAAELHTLLADTGVEPLLLALAVRAKAEAGVNPPGGWALARLGDMFGTGVAPARLAASVAPWLGLRNRIYMAARTVLAGQFGARLAALIEGFNEDDVLADVSFPLTDQGQALYRRVLGGDLAPLFDERAGLRVRHGLLTHHARRTLRIELMVPFAGHRVWQTQLDAVARAEVQTDGAGRLVVVYSAKATDATMLSNRLRSELIFSAALSARDGEPRRDNFRLSFSDQRTVNRELCPVAWYSILDAYGLPRPELPEGNCRATLNVSVPGELVEAWTLAPHSRDENFLPTMCRVSRAVQASMRRWVPALYLNSYDRYRAPSVVMPLLAWQCSQPYSGIKKGRFSYDSMDTASMERALASASRRLGGVLETVREMLTAAGLPEVADYYDPGDVRFALANVLRQRRRFASLLVADSFFIEELVRLADCGRELRSLAGSEPAKAVRNFQRYAAQMVRAFHRSMRRLYANEDFVALGVLLLVEATAALTGHPGTPSQLAATLTVQTVGGTRIYQNEAARRL